MTEDPKAEAKELLKRHFKRTQGYYLGFKDSRDEEIESIVDLIVEAAVAELKDDLEKGFYEFRQGQRFRASRGL